MKGALEFHASGAPLDPRCHAAIQELTTLVAEQYPKASFVVSPGEEDPSVTHIIATVDVADPDEVVDLVIDRLLELQLQEGLPVHLIPVRTPERTARLAQELQARRTHPVLPPSPVS